MMDTCLSFQLFQLFQLFFNQLFFNYFLLLIAVYVLSSWKICTYILSSWKMYTYIFQLNARLHQKGATFCVLVHRIGETRKGCTACLSSAKLVRILLSIFSICELSARCSTNVVLFLGVRAAVVPVL
jgi:hypothetical protein